IAPDYYRSYVLLYRLLGDEGKKEESQKILQSAEDHLKQLVERYPEITYYHQFLGLVYQVGGKIDEAVKSLEKAIEMRPSDKTTFQLLGQILASSKRYEEMVDLLKRWVKYNPNDQEAKRMLEQYENSP
ncbi:MAG: tetratricopeptide repeat protein, partial [Candidatus Zixiibacteriota bacterium]